VADPTVVVVAREFKQALLLREAQQMQDMAGRWLQIEHKLDAQIAALASQFEEERVAGRAISEAKLYRMRRYQLLTAQLQEEVGSYTGYAGTLIADKQREWGALGIRHAATLTQLSYETGVGAFFDRLPVAAIETMVGLAGDGSPLNTLLRQSWPDAVDGLTEALINGTALGWNPTKTARYMREGMASGLDRALTILRTEQIRAYRESERMQYEHSGVVDGYYRIVAHDGRTCAACLMAEGEFYRNRDALRDHPNGRCSTVPKVRGLPSLQFEKGPAWFAKQPEETQLQILGPGKYAAWRDGKFGLADLVTVRKDATWGDSVTPTPLRELVKA